MNAVVRRPLIAVLMLPVLLHGLAACSNIDVVAQPDVESSELLADFSDSTTAIPDRWWSEFSDDRLNQLIGQALENNYDLKASLARLRQSEALLRINSAEQYPSVNLNGGKSRAWSESATSDSWSAGLSASYEIDFWGAIAGNRQRAEYDLFASRAASRIQANTVASQVANAWFGLLHETHLITLLEQQKQRIESGLKVINARFQRGQSQVSDVWQQQTLLESIDGDLVSATARRDIFQQQLQLWLASSIDLGSIQQLLPSVVANHIKVSAAALFERPDVQQAFFTVQSANADVAVAKANRYPRVTLSASYSGQDPSINNVFDNWVANLAGNLVLPLIDGGNRRAQVKSQQALLDARIADYQQVYLQAAQQVQEVLVTLDEQQRLDTSLQRQLQLSRKTESFQTSRYRKGVGDYLSLLNAQRDVLALERLLLNNQLNFNLTRIRLYQAVSHGRFSDVETDSQPLSQESLSL